MSAAINSGTTALLSTPPPCQHSHDALSAAPLLASRPAADERCPDPCPRVTAGAQEKAPPGFPGGAHVTPIASSVTERGDATHDRQTTTPFEGADPCRINPSPSACSSSTASPSPFECRSPLATAWPLSPRSECSQSCDSPSGATPKAPTCPPTAQPIKPASPASSDSSQAEADAARLALKALASLQAESALAGYELVQLADGSLIVSRWGMVRPLGTLAEARAWLQRVVGSAGAPG